MTPTASDLYGLALEDTTATLCARRPDGTITPLALGRWLGGLTPADGAVLDRARSPVLDVGCGPGRHVLALARRGHLALGVDIAPTAVRLARLRGARVIEASVFARIPGAGTWGSALLLDGNIGIGGEPGALLARLRQLLRPAGEVLVELAPPGVVATSERIRLEVDGRRSRSFAWAYVGTDAIAAVARTAGFAVPERWEHERRWFARLVASR
jgi:SAM-dependent methyltransferase